MDTQSLKAKLTLLIERWLRYKFVGGEFTPLSKPFRASSRQRGAAEIPGAGPQDDWAGRDSNKTVE
jgi:hypothetical protein